jgi:hypothetical protein
VQHEPLVVEADLALDLLERQLRVRVGDLVVEAQEQPLELGDDDVLVVARIAMMARACAAPLRGRSWACSGLPSAVPVSGSPSRRRRPSS